MSMVMYCPSQENLNTYRRIAQKAGKIWREHGALEYRECVGEDLDVKWGVAFPKTLKVKTGETVRLFLHRLQITRSPRFCKRQGYEGQTADRNDGCQRDAFDCKRMVYGGFKVIVDA